MEGLPGKALAVETGHDTADLAVWPYPVQEGDVVAKFAVAGDPQPKNVGNRVKRGYTERYQARDAYVAALKAAARDAVPSANGSDCVSLYGVRCRFFRATMHRTDCDNLYKAVSDAMTGILWGDDSQVVELFSRMYLPSKNPRVEVLVHRVPHFVTPRCCRCQTLIVPADAVGRYCSERCANRRRPGPSPTPPPRRRPWTACVRRTPASASRPSPMRRTTRLATTGRSGAVARGAGSSRTGGA